MMSQTTLGEHAVAYAVAGHDTLPLHWPVPSGCSCGNPECEKNIGKHPLTEHGKDDATSDPETTAARWDRWPQANIAIRPAKGTVVVDVDPRAKGATTLVRLLTEQRRELPQTLTSNTGGDGLHIWFTCPGPYRGKLCPGVDIKTNAGYVVVPPSVHKSGRTYSWANELAVAPAPAWLQKLIQQPRIAPPPVLRHAAGGGVTDGLVRYVATMPEGGDSRCLGRNAALFWAVGRALQEGFGQGVINQLADAGRSAGLSEREIERVIKSARGRVAA